MNHVERLMVTVSLRAATAVVAAALGCWAIAAAAQSSGPLPSWNDGAAKQAILEFVSRTTREGGPDFVPVEDRVAAFDQDGTLWVEHPVYTQVMFDLDRVPDLVKAKPELADQEPFKTVLTGDHAAIAKLSLKELFEVVIAVQSDMTVEAFAKEVNDWFGTARHPRWNRPYTELVYQPMLEVLAYFRANGFKTFIATGGNAGVVRAYSQRVYGIPPEQVSGSVQPLRFAVDPDGTPTLTREPKMALSNLEAGKIENFYMVYGKRPYAQFGNSSSDDQQALEYVKTGPGLRLSVAILHDDPEREYAYGPAQGLPDTSVGTFSQAMYDMAIKQGWIVVSMKNDWKTIFREE